ncbi:unnamed protein product [Cuscuta epithymum]|uniref:Uncharacterized protein n=1 Tax=Cuscuta epithymum TaxID=186058 RepID=A0AAV0G846_9ASTE|nr:unnamed protein product [Cuscuta epithymum]
MYNGVRNNALNCTATSDADPVLKYITQILLEEQEESIDEPFDLIALKAAENSYYEALHENPSSLFDSSAGRSSWHDNVDGIVDPGDSESPCVTSERPPNLAIQLTSSSDNYDLNGSSSYNFDNAMMSFLRASSAVRNVFGGNDDTESKLELQRCMEEASRFLPGHNKLVMDDLEATKDVIVIDTEKDHSHRGKKHYYLPQESGLEEERESKQSAVYEEVDLSQMFDKVLLCSDDKGYSFGVGEKGRRGRRHSKKWEDNCDIVDVLSLLTSCAQSVHDGDYKGAQAQLKEIRQHSSPVGNSNQRLAHLIANSLEARLAGTGTQLCKAISPKTIAASEFPKSYLTSWPIMRISTFFSNQMIFEAASRGTSLHIIDFGILYGIQWPTLIRDLSQRPGGPPRLRITGIELPQTGFRPSQMLVETGVRLSRYCERYGVPFEFNALTSQHWEAIKIDDLKLVSGGEVIAINSNFRFDYLLDETLVAGYNPKDEVLNLIREVNPDIYVQTVHSGSHSSPFFLPRFRETLFFYSAIFDMCDSTLPNRHHPQRLSFEQEFLGRETMNIIGCEGIERLHRPETYKQWESRMLRAGLKPLPLNSQLVNKLLRKARASYHKDFLFIEDGLWVLQGWKGRVLGGSSCWVAT